MERPSEPPAASTIVFAAIVFYGLMSIGGLIALSFTDLSAGEAIFGPDLGPDGHPPDHLLHGLLGVGTGLAVVLASWLARRMGALDKLQREFAQLLGPLSPSSVAVLAVTSAIGEELLFRGALQPLIGFWPTAIIFGLLHGGMTPRLWTWTVFALLAGVLLGWLAEHTQSLLAPILCHFTVNFWNLHALAADARDLAPPPPHSDASDDDSPEDDPGSDDDAPPPPPTPPHR